MLRREVSISPRGRAAATAQLASRAREYLSESEAEEDTHCCGAGKIAWEEDDGRTKLSETPCKAVGTIMSHMLSEDFPVGCTEVHLCSKHSTQYLTARYAKKCSKESCKRLGTVVSSGVRLCDQHASDVPSRTPTRRSRSRSRSVPQEPKTTYETEEQVGYLAEDEEVDDEENGIDQARALLRRAAEGEGEEERPKRVRRLKSPGHTPKASAINRNLARLGMLDSPDVDRSASLLEEFTEKFLAGKEHGKGEAEVRASICNDRLKTQEEVLKALIMEAEVEQAKGQRGLTRFLQSWRGTLSDLERMKQTYSPTPQVDSEQSGSWSMVSSQKTSPSTPKVPSWAEGSSSERPAELRIAPPSVFKPDRKAGAGGADAASRVKEEPITQIAKALQSQTAELATLVRHQSEGGGSQPVGTLKGLNRQSEELVFLLRACGQYSVQIGENDHGQGLANALLAAQVGASTQLREAGFRQRMTTRLAIGIAGPYWGAHEKYTLSAADFISYTDAELDQFASEIAATNRQSQKATHDQRPPPPTRYDECMGFTCEKGE